MSLETLVLINSPHVDELYVYPDFLDYLEHLESDSRRWPHANRGQMHIVYAYRLYPIWVSYSRQTTVAASRPRRDPRLAGNLPARSRVVGQRGAIAVPSGTRSATKFVPCPRCAAQVSAQSYGEHMRRSHSVDVEDDNYVLTEPGGP